MENIDMDDRFSEICDTLSIGAAIENMLLAAQELGVGSLWIGKYVFCIQGTYRIYRRGRTAYRSSCI